MLALERPHQLAGGHSHHGTGCKKNRPQYIAKSGNTYSCEWWWSKIWHCLKVAPNVFDTAYSWVELADWIPSGWQGWRILSS